MRSLSLLALVLGACGSGHGEGLPASLLVDLGATRVAALSPAATAPAGDDEDLPRSASGDGGAAPGDGDAAAPAPPPLVAPSATVRISVRSTPRAAVSWGRRSLGVTPVSLDRPRDSGPMDLVLRASGYLTLHTRAYTFRNDSVSVDLVPLGKIDTLVGARRALPSDGGVPPDLTPAPQPPLPLP